MASKQNLSYTVWLNDQTQKGYASAKRNMQGLQNLGKQTQQSWRNTGSSMSGIGGGVAALWGASAGIQSMLQPAREMNAARGELMSLLGANGADTADIVQSAGMDFSEKFGKSSAEFVSSAYDIQSAIDGLSANNLATFTTASAVLATATKADTATITSYMGTMYGIFETNANKIGKSKWVEQITGQTATAVKMFKTTGSAMNEAFAGVGARGANQGISSGEQFAVLGALQSSMGGSVAGTAYAGFLDAIPNAEKVLNMSLSGANGKALGMVDIIEKLKSQLGTDLGTKQLGEINKAFGTSAGGLIGNLWNKTESLKANISTLSNVSGMEKASSMASAIVDPWNQLEQASNNVRISFGQTLNNSLMPVVTYMIGGAQTIRKWLTMFPNLAKAASYLTIGIIGLTAALATHAIVVGGATLAWGRLKIMWTATGIPKLIGWMSKLNIVMLLLNKTTWRLAAAWLLSFGWIPLAIGAAIVAVGLLWAYWEEFTDWLSSTWNSMKEWFGFESTLNVNNQTEEMNARLSSVGQTTNQENAKQLPLHQITNSASNSNTNNSRNIGSMTINTNKDMNQNQLNAFLAMSAP